MPPYLYKHVHSYLNDNIVGYESHDKDDILYCKIYLRFYDYLVVMIVSHKYYYHSYLDVSIIVRNKYYFRYPFGIDIKTSKLSEFVYSLILLNLKLSGDSYLGIIPRDIINMIARLDHNIN